MERMQTSLDEVEAAFVRRVAVEEDRPVSAMLRRLVQVAMLRDGSGRSPAGLPVGSVADLGAAGRAAAEKTRPVVVQGRSLAAIDMSGGPHEFRPQAQNPLKCVDCGMKMGDHRG